MQKSLKFIFFLLFLNSIKKGSKFLTPSFVPKDKLKFLRDPKVRMKNQEIKNGIKIKIEEYKKYLI